MWRKQEREVNNVGCGERRQGEGCENGVYWERGSEGKKREKK